MRYLLLLLLFAFKLVPAQNLAPADLELLHEQFNRANFLKAKGYMQSADSTMGALHLTEYTNVASGSLLQVVDLTDSEGATTFTVHCYLTSEAAYNAFVNRLKESGFTGPKENVYKKLLSTYVTETVQSKGKQLFNGRSVYELQFVLAAGKEVALPPH